MSPKKPASAPNATLHRRRAAAAHASPSSAVQPLSSTPHQHFQEECSLAIEAIRTSIHNLCASLDADPLLPQEVSRRFRLNKNLTWKFARVLVAQNPMDAIAMLPGPEGIEIFLRAFENAGANPALLSSAREAIAGFDEIVERHFGARTELELALDGMRTDGNLEDSRRLAFRGQSGVTGMYAHSRFTIQIVAPSSTNEDYADIALVAGLIRLRRLRPRDSLPVFRALASDPAHGKIVEPLCNAHPPHGEGAPNDFVLRDFSSHPFASVETLEHDGRLTVEVKGGSIGKIGESTLCFGSITRSVFNRVQIVDAKGQLDAVGSFATAISLPVEHFANDVYVHRSILDVKSLRTSIHSTLAQPLSSDETQHAKTILPIDLKTEIHQDGSSAPWLACVPRHEELVAMAFRALGSAPSDYILIRVAMQYPPVPSTVWVAWDLPPRGG